MSREAGSGIRAILQPRRPRITMLLWTMVLMSILARFYLLVPGAARCCNRLTMMPLDLDERDIGGVAAGVVRVAGRISDECVAPAPDESGALCLRPLTVSTPMRGRKVRRALLWKSAVETNREEEAD